MKSNAHFYGTYLVMIVFLDYVFADNFQLRIETFAIKMRTAFTSLIYRKVLKINLSQDKNISLGKIMTLITRDVNEFEVSIVYITTMIANVIYFFGVCFILYAEVGWLVVILMSIFSLIVLIQSRYPTN
jgi:ATP-binding cassette subfamily C (CFTR/MRP) protein 4